jgi:hypothetical protein
MTQPLIWINACLRLRKAEESISQIAEIQHCIKLPLTSPAMVRLYHDTLLFVLANAFDDKSYCLAESELKRLVVILNRHKKNKRWQYMLSNSGLPYTELRSQYSASLIKWLINSFPAQIVPIEAESKGEIFQQLSQSALPVIEFHHTTQGEYNIWNRIKWLSGHYRNIAALKWLFNMIEQQNWPAVLKDQLYDNLKIFVSWKLNADDAGITSNRWPVKSVIFKNPVKLKTESLSILKTNVTDPLPLSIGEKNHLISTIRESLALHARETDPVTYADPGETFLYEMGDGLQIALTGMIKERRLSLESYIGYMAFKNGIPVSYGGGWIWGHSCKIGINIYPPFRGGDSDKLFCQIMRLYFQVYLIRRFVVKPYQFGKGNPEGLKSGAFWFYYKLGFRPVSRDISNIANMEWNKIKSHTNYRTPISILKKLTICNLEWEPAKTIHKFLEADKISMVITQMINKKFSSDRKLAVEKSKQEMKKFLGLKRLPNFNSVEKIIWNSWSLFFVCLPGTANWTVSERRKFQKLLYLKSKGSEIDFIGKLQQHSHLWASMEGVLKS